MATQRLWANHGRFIVFSLAVIVLLNCVVFGRLVTFELINHDDPYFVTLNAHVTGGLTLGNLRWALTTHEMGIWHPLTWMSYQLETTLFGADNPGARHAVNLGIHLLSAVVLFLFCLRLTGAGWPSLLVAVLFSIHPQHVQPVAWIAERKEVLAALFFLLSLYFYATYRARGNSGPLYAASLCAFAVALLCKPSAAPLPAVLVLIDLFHRPANGDRPPMTMPSGTDIGGWVGLLRNKVPYFLLSALASGITIYIKKTGGWAGWEQVLPLTRRLWLMPIGLLHYLHKLVAPSPNRFWIEPPPGTPYLRSLLSLGVLAALAWLVWRLRHRCAELVFGSLWFVIMWLPISGLVLVGKHYVADRYTYLPYIGIFFGLVFLARAWCGTHPAARRAAFALAVAVVAVYSTLAYRQTGYWRDSITFFQRELELNPLSAAAQVRLGQALLEKGERAQALARFQAAIDLDAHDPLAYRYKADALYELGRMDEAMDAFREEIAHGARRAYPFVILGRALVERGAAEEGVQLMEQGLERFPDDPYLLSHAAHAYGFSLAEPQQALSHYLRLIRLQPTNTDAHYAAAVLYLRGGDEGRALDMLARLLELDPGNQAARDLVQQIRG